MAASKVRDSSTESAIPSGFYTNGHKRLKTLNDGCSNLGLPTSVCGDSEVRNPKYFAKVTDYSNPFTVRSIIKTLDAGRYGSVTKEMEEIANMKMHPSLWDSVDGEKNRIKGCRVLGNHHVANEVIDLEDGYVTKNLSPSTSNIVILDSDDEETESKRAKYPFRSQYMQSVVPHHSSLEVVPQYPYQKVVLEKACEQHPIRGMLAENYQRAHFRMEDKYDLIGSSGIVKDQGVYVGVEDDDSDDSEAEDADDGLGDIWNEMAVAKEFAKDVMEESLTKEEKQEETAECDHSYVLKDDLGYVCRVCGVIEKSIETIIDVQFTKVRRSTRTYASDSQNTKDGDTSGLNGIRLSEDGFIISGISAHPRHTQQMKPHQIEGFNFLCSNLVTDNPGGCILAHAPGSGKTFMIISFMQSFLAKYPNARPLVVLPKGILATWKKEFQTWQVEDIPVYDFYTMKADNRAQQLEVLKLWVEEKSILFLGYKQFSTIVCESGTSKLSAACQEILLKAPSLLILDEGHTPRNENTDVLQSLAKVQTPRKVVLSGTLYQNHVKEVFNILNLVRPKFLRLDTSKSIVKRILSRAPVSNVRKHLKAGADVAFCDIVEHTLQRDEDFKMKISVIQDLREMTKNVLHYYKGDFLDELPGLVDFTVVLNLSSKQMSEVHKLRKLDRKFKVSSIGSAVYLHPKLKSLSENSIVADANMDEMLEKLDIREGAKAKFFVNMLNLCDSAGEKLLVFSQYLVPLKFLERLAAQTRAWKVGKEIFVITGDTSAEQRELSMDRFNNSPDAKLFFGSIKACGEGISLVGASRIIILDVHLNPSVTRQAIGRAFRPGQKKKVHVYRLVAASSPEEDDHKTCFKKEVISKSWFEWNEFCGYRDFEVETVDLDDCGDIFLESPLLKEDIKALYKR